jgi:transmembrane sensor
MTEQRINRSSPAGEPAPDWEAIARHLTGESSPEEDAQVRRWLEQHPGERALVERLNEVAVPGEPEDVDVEAALRNVHARLNDTRRPMLTVERGGGRWRSAVGVLLAAAAAVVLFVTLHRVSPDTEPAAAPQTFATAIGERKTIVLADSTRVVLGPDSRLVVPAAYATARSIELRGDAYFDVRHDAAHPFAVHVNRAVIEDIGTTFTVESDAGDTTSVSVISGSVRLRAAASHATDGAVLAAGDRGSITNDGSIRAFPHAAAADDAAWVSGRLVFRDASFSRVGAELRRWYGIELRAADAELLRQHVTTTLEGESADQALKILGLSLGAHVERRGDTATVYLAPSR